MGEPFGLRFTDVEMDANNVDVVMGCDDISQPIPRGHVLRASPSGRLATLGTVMGVAGPINLELDYDATWVLAGGDLVWTNWLAGLPVGGGVVTTFFSVPSRGRALVGFAVDRDPGSWPYVIGTAAYPSTLWTIESADRRGFLSTIVSARSTGRGGPIAFAPRSGDYFVASGKVIRVTKQGSITTINTLMTNAHAIAMQQDGTAWVGTWEWPSYPPIPALYRIDAQGRVLSVVRFPFLSSYSFTGLAVYGERRVVCAGSGKPGTVAAVRLQSRRPGDAGKPYVLACSLARRPGIPVPGGTAVDLAPDPLLFLSASGLAPGIFRAFQGVTDRFGEASAWVVLPARLPPRLGITVFVAGVIYDGAGIRTATNTYRFVLS